MQTGTGKACSPLLGGELREAGVWRPHWEVRWVKRTHGIQVQDGVTACGEQATEGAPVGSSEHVVPSAASGPFRVAAAPGPGW